MGSLRERIMLSLLFLIGLGLCSSKVPTLGLYYESLDPYSRQFIKDEVWKVWKLHQDEFAVEFVAYGNAKTSGDPENGFSITCQHGERECVGNKVQACTVKYVTDTFKLMYLMNCLSSDPSPDQAGPRCFQELSLDYAQVDACSKNEEGETLHYENGVKHNSLTPSAYAVPWFTWDDEGSDEIIDQMDELGLEGYLCAIYGIC